MNKNIPYYLKSIKIKSIDLFFDIFEKLTGNFLSIHLRPIKESSYHLRPEKQNSKIAIVVQGPLLLTNHFTFETLKLYKKIFPDSILVLSTWDVENKIELEKIKKLQGVEVVINEFPKDRGPKNFNLQIINTKAGIKKALEFEPDYILKTRTDHRIYNPSIFTIMNSLLESIPAQNNYTQQKRIVASSFGSRINIPYHITDMFLYGASADIFKYWDVELVGNNELKDEGPEAYLVKRYFTSMGRNISNTIEDGLNIIRDNFIFLDRQTIDLYWCKYLRWQENKGINYTDRAAVKKDTDIYSWLTMQKF